MPSSMIFTSLVVLWLLILVPTVARHRQEVARPSVAALSGRVLERPRQRRGDAHRGPDMGRAARGRELEVYAMDEVDEPRGVATRSDRDREVRIPEARVQAERIDPRWDDAGPGPAAEAWADEDGEGPEGWYDDEDGRWERPPPRYRPGRGGFDPEAAALTARARYAFRQRVVLTMLIAAAVTGVVAGFAEPGLWWAHACVDLALVGYLVYLRRQVRMEEAIRERRAARMAGTRRPAAAEDPELDEWARRGREAGAPSDLDGDEGGTGDDEVSGSESRSAPPVDDLAREQPRRVAGTGDPLRIGPTDVEVSHPDPVEPEPALPRLQPAPPPPLPAGTSLVEVDEEDPELYRLDGPVVPDYRRAAGE